MAKVVLIGAGHAHLTLLKNLSSDIFRRHNFQIVSPSRFVYYSGSIPKFIAGELLENEIRIDLVLFARRLGVEWIEAKLNRVEFPSLGGAQDRMREVPLMWTDKGQELKADLFSFNVGGQPLKTIQSDRILSLRPFEQFVEQWRQILRFSSERLDRIAVIGGGPAAVEVACALRRVQKRQKIPGASVRLISKSSRLCPAYSEVVSDSIARDLSKLGVEVRLNQDVDLASQASINSCEFLVDAQLIFDVRPIASHDLLNRPHDQFLRVSERVFSLGDGARSNSQTRYPRSGVLAVHQGRYLAEAFEVMLRGSNLNLRAELKPFESPARTLNILDLSNQSARLVWGPFTWAGAFPKWLKTRLDTAYLESVS